MSEAKSVGLEGVSATGTTGPGYGSALDLAQRQSNAVLSGAPDTTAVTPASALTRESAAPKAPPMPPTNLTVAMNHERVPPQQRPPEPPLTPVVADAGAGLEIGDPRPQEEPAVPAPPTKRKRRAKAKAEIKVKSRKEAILYSRVVIAAFDEVLDYAPHRRHNQPVPDLFMDDAVYLREIRHLVGELRKINSLLESPRNNRAAAAAAGVWGKRVNTFLDAYAKSLAKPAAWMTMLVVVGFLSKLGVGQDVISVILGHVKPPH
jgi:hypothetical protein